ncbi:MAG: pilin [Patescibacteria group bacterium]
MYQNKLLIIIITIVLLTIGLIPLGSLALDDFGLYDTAKNTILPVGTPSPFSIIAAIIQIILSVVGVAALLIIIYGGFQWMTSSGNEEKISKAKKLIAGAAIGLVIILSSYIIVSFIYSSLQKGISPIAPAGESPLLGNECDFDNDCGPNLKCDLATHTCVPVPCPGICLEFSQATADCVAESSHDAACQQSNPNTRCFVNKSVTVICP